MKVVLLVLSGDPDTAAKFLNDRLPASDVQILTRADIDGRSWRGRLKAVRAKHPEVLAVFTERVAWQRGQNAFFALGSLCGAQQTVLFDRHGGWRQETRAHTVAASAFRFGIEAKRSAAAMMTTRKELDRLEKAIKLYPRRHDPKSSHLPRIAYLRSSPGPGTQAGGAATHITGFINAAVTLGAELSLISNDAIAGLENSGIAQTIIPPESVGSTRAAFDVYNNILFTKRSLSEIAQRRPDLIYQRYARFSSAGVAAAVQTGVPLFLEYNGSEVWVGRYWDRVDKLDLLARFERLNLKAATRIFVVSEVERENLLRAGVAKEKIIVNPNGVDIDRFKPGIGGEHVRQEFGIGGDEMVAGFVGTFGPWHGVDVLAKAITFLPPELRLRFLLIGSGALRSRVEEILREGNAAQRAILTGAVPHDRVPSMLDACDILVSPHVPLEDGSDFFGSPTKLFEYMAMGKGIVASRLGQIGEVLKDRETALLVEPGNIEELANAILELTNAPELRARLGNAARRLVGERYTWTRNARTVLDTYNTWHASQ